MKIHHRLSRMFYNFKISWQQMSVYCVRLEVCQYAISSPRRERICSHTLLYTITLKINLLSPNTKRTLHKSLYNYLIIETNTSSNIYIEIYKVIVTIMTL